MKSGNIKLCGGCGEVRTESNTDIGTNGYFRFKCKNCFSLHCKDYEKTLRGYLVRAYRNMLSRVMGIQKAKEHLYKGKDILNREDFYQWSIDNDCYINLHTYWVLSKYIHKLAPSVDRIDSTMGYTKGNIRWITQSENSRLGAIVRNSIHKEV